MNDTRRALSAMCLALAIALPAPNVEAQMATGGAEVARPADSKPPDAEARLYAVEIRTGPKWDAALPPQQQAWFKEHSANLRRLRDEGRLVLGARYAEVGLVILSAASIDEARAMISQDPAMAHGTFTFQVHEFNVFYPGNVPARARR